MKICDFIRDLWEDDNAVGVVEIILILVDNPFTSSTYILSY